MPEPAADSTTRQGSARLRRAGALAAGPLAALAVYWLLAPSGGAGPDLSEAGRRVGAVMAWMAVWWLSEAIPLPATSLIPLVLFPVLGVFGEGREGLAKAAAPYADRIIFLFMGGFMLALAMERWDLHKRIALVTVLLVGSNPVMVVGGFMLATGVLSMWMSNTATTVMMLPIAASVARLVAERTGSHPANFATCLMLGIAYGASIGGVATPIGTPPNAILLGYLKETFGLEITFLRWMMVGLPLVAVFLPATWLILTKLVFPIQIREIPGGRDLFRGELRRLGRVSRAEWTVMSVFFLTVALWVTNGLISKEFRTAHAWLQGIDDTAIAIFAAVLLFTIPVSLSRGVFTLDWDSAVRLPWGVLLLFGGGLSRAAAVKASGTGDLVGLDEFIGMKVQALGRLPTPVIVLAVTTIVVFLTEVTSNTATATIFVAILGGIAVTLGIDPLLLTVPAAVAASCAFMMPVATPPNAIVFGSGYVTIRQMAKAGIWLNILSIVLVSLITHTAVVWALGADTSGLPAWAAPGAAAP